jgi:hypothetical protein
MERRICSETMAKSEKPRATEASNQREIAGKGRNSPNAVGGSNGFGIGPLRADDIAVTLQGRPSDVPLQRRLLPIMTPTLLIAAMKGQVVCLPELYEYFADWSGPTLLSSHYESVKRALENNFITPYTHHDFRRAKFDISLTSYSGSWGTTPGSRNGPGISIWPVPHAC